MKCPKCQNDMEKGMLKPEGSNIAVQQWGAELNFLRMLKNGKNVDTYRCKSCGYLESYAK